MRVAESAEGREGRGGSRGQMAEVWDGPNEALGEIKSNGMAMQGGSVMPHKSICRQIRSTLRRCRNSPDLLSPMRTDAWLSLIKSVKVTEDIDVRHNANLTRESMRKSGLGLPSTRGSPPSTKILPAWNLPKRKNQVTYQSHEKQQKQ